MARLGGPHRMLPDQPVAAVDQGDADAERRGIPYSGYTDLAALVEACARAGLFVSCSSGTTGKSAMLVASQKDLDFTGMFHGVDERVPVDALHFGTRVMEHFLMHA